MCSWLYTVKTIHNDTGQYGVPGCEVECLPYYQEDLSLIHKSGCQLCDFHRPTDSSYVLVYQEVESKEIGISFKNLFINQWKVNMFKTKLRLWTTHIFCYFVTCFVDLDQTVQTQVWFLASLAETQQVTSISPSPTKFTGLPRKILNH